MIALARAHRPSTIDYRVLDATDYGALIRLGASSFDVALCNMALMDMAETDPLMNATAVVLKARRPVRIFGPPPLLQQSVDGPNGRTG